MDDLLTQSPQDFVAGLRPRPQSTLFVGPDVRARLSPEMAARVPAGVSTGAYGRDIFDSLYAAGQSALMEEQARTAQAAEAEKTRIRELATRAATLDSTRKMITSLGLPPAVETQMLKDSMRSIMEPPKTPGGVESFALPGGGKALKVTQPGGRFSIQRLPAHFGPPGMVVREGIPGMEQIEEGTGRVVRQNIPRPPPDREADRSASRDEWLYRERQTSRRRQIEDEIAAVRKAMAAPAPGAPGWLTSSKSRAKYEAYQALPGRLKTLQAQLDAVMSGKDPEQVPPANPPQAPANVSATPTNAAPVPVMKWVRDPKTGKLVKA